MAQFSIICRYPKVEGYFYVYIRISHKSKTDYINTGKLASNKTWDDKRQMLKDRPLRIMIDEQICKYVDMINKKDLRGWTVQDIKKYLLTGSEDISYTEYANQYIADIRNNGKDGTATVYLNVLKSLQTYFSREDIMCSALTRLTVDAWVKWLLDSGKKSSAKNYPVYAKAMFARMMDIVNDYDANIVKLTHNPFDKIGVKTPITQQAKKSLSAEELRRLFAVDVSVVSEFVQIHRDYLLFSLCLAGINYADLIELKKDAYHDGVISWNRRKTRDRKQDGSHMELVAPKIVREILERRKDPKGVMLTDMSRHYSNSNNACSVAKKMIKQLSKEAGITISVTPYCMRHSWATIAVNDLKQPVDDVAFAMTHASAHTMTMGYVRPDYSRATRVNNAVVAYIFGEDAV